MDAHKRPHSHRTKKVIIGVVVAGLLLVAATFLYMYVSHTGVFTKKDDTTPKVTEQLTPDQIEARDIENQKNTLEKNIATEKDATKKSDMQVELSVIYYNQTDLSKSLDVARAAEQTKPSATSAAVIADSYFAQKNYKQAAKYYGIAMDRSEKPASSHERSPYNDYLNQKLEAEANQ